MLIISLSIKLTNDTWFTNDCSTGYILCHIFKDDTNSVKKQSSSFYPLELYHILTEWFKNEKQ